MSLNQIVRCLIPFERISDIKELGSFRRKAAGADV